MCLRISGLRLLFKNFGGAPGGFLHEIPHFGALRLEVNGDAAREQNLSACGTDRADHAGRESVYELRFQSVFLSHLQDVIHLAGVGEHHHARPAFRDRLHGFEEQGGVFGKRPAINRHAEHFHATMLKLPEKRLVGHSVFLHGHAAPLEREPARVFIQLVNDLAPRVWLGNGHGDGHVQVAQDLEWLGAARDHRGLGECLNELLKRIAGAEHFGKRPRANASHENHRVQAPRKELLGKGKRFRMIFERQLAHGRRDARDAAQPLDHAGHFGRHATLEGNHFEAVKSLFCCCRVAHRLHRQAQ